MHDLRSELKDEAQADRFAADWRTCDLDSATAALLRYTEKLTRDPSGCNAQDIAALREAGLSDPAIHDAVQVCSYFNYINRIANGLGVDDETWLDALGRAQAPQAD